ncbi:SDR family NAD(P)-dependent oxidoreductase [uncultured Martelella sp.]|uniref:SDR family NAD(P)-dependent oxidoreductase n=1 Tax=uncultured Martelella sp. TaxID=392331 RepID=UPI0029C76A28|nr:SDR family NAD(P)-dependent oxidoreductase [uncultured Martelella sp.]
MISNDQDATTDTVLIIGASRGLGYAMATEFLKRGWRVIATVRGPERTLLHDLADVHPDHIGIEQLDITEPDQVAALRERVSRQCIDILFVNAGTANANQDETIAAVSTEEFIRVMVTNALSPMRVVEGLQDCVAPMGLIGVMSSGQGSVGNNTKGGHEVYRGSKAALNQYMRSYAARHASDSRPLVLMAPGWIRTGLGGPDAPYSMEETVPQIVSTLLAQRGKPGLQYLDREGQIVPW